MYVYAGFVPPGKHQIIINDQKTNQFFMREIVVDARARDIVNCSKYNSSSEIIEIKLFIF